jgi:hypothetical protein
MTSLVLLLALSAPSAEPAKPAPAKVTITAEVACAHCAFGIESEGGCAPCLKLDDKTPVILKGKISEPLLKARFDKKVFVVEGTLSVNKEKVLVLDLSAARERTDADKGKAPDAGQARLTGTVTPKDGGLTLQNGTTPVTVESKVAPTEEKPVTVTGKLGVKDGKPRLEASSLEPVEKK